MMQDRDGWCDRLMTVQASSVAESSFLLIKKIR